MIAGNAAVENHPVVVDVAADERQSGIAGVDQRRDDPGLQVLPTSRRNWRSANGDDSTRGALLRGRLAVVDVGRRRIWRREAAEAAGGMITCGEQSIKKADGRASKPPINADTRAMSAGLHGCSPVGASVARGNFSRWDSLRRDWRLAVRGAVNPCNCRHMHSLCQHDSWPRTAPILRKSAGFQRRVRRTAGREVRRIPASNGSSKQPYRLGVGIEMRQTDDQAADRRSQPSPPASSRRLLIVDQSMARLLRIGLNRLGLIT